MEKQDTPHSLKRPVLLSADELAELLQVSLSKAYMIMRQGELPVVKLGRSVRVRREDVDAYIQRNTCYGYDPR